MATICCPWVEDTGSLSDRSGDDLISVVEFWLMDLHTDPLYVIAL